MYLHHLLNVPVQFANKMGFQKTNACLTKTAVLKLNYQNKGFVYLLRTYISTDKLSLTPPYDHFMN
jgi:hypothetical protein